jgi:hypothetical protein
MPFFDQVLTPAMPGRGPYGNEVVKRWTAEIWWIAALKIARKA